MLHAKLFFAPRVVMRGVANGSWDAQSATLAKRLMRLPRKQKVVSSNLTGGSRFCQILCCLFLRYWFVGMLVHPTPGVGPVV